MKNKKLVRYLTQILIHFGMKKQSVPIFYELLELQSIDREVIIRKEDKEIIATKLGYVNSKNNIQIITNFINQLCSNGLAKKKEKANMSKKSGKTIIVFNKKLFGNKEWLEKDNEKEYFLYIDCSKTNIDIYNPFLKTNKKEK